MLRTVLEPFKKDCQDSYYQKILREGLYELKTFSRSISRDAVFNKFSLIICFNTLPKL